MAVLIRGTEYQLPREDGRSGPTGAEIDTIEDRFDVDYHDLMSQLGDDPVRRKGCSRTRALYSMVWIAMHRVDPAVTIDDVMAEYGLDELEFTGVDAAPADGGEAAEVAANPTDGDSGSTPSEESDAT